MEPVSTRLFSWQRVILIGAAFLGVVVILQRSLRYVCENHVTFDCPYYWPVSILNLRFPAIQDFIVATIVTALFFLIYRHLEARRFSLPLVVIAGVLLIAGVTLIHGISEGFYAPIAGDARSGTLTTYSLEGQEYFHDALTIEDPIDFFRRYNEIQPTLHSHAHTHPPGAVLTFYFLRKIFHDPGIMALIIMLLSTAGTAFFFSRLLRTHIDDELTARFTTFLLLLLPAVQIYYLATIDGIVAALLTGTLYFFCFGKGRLSTLGAAALLLASFLLTFVSLFILPVLVGFDLIVRRSLKRSLLVIGSVVAAHAGIYLLTGYSAFQSFRAASAYENPLGFMLFVNPANYLFTRLEDVAEVVFFLGPFLLILFFRAMRTIRLRPLDVLTGLACLTLIGMYAAGAWRTGETARAGLFMYPYLLFPVARYLEEAKANAGARLQIASLVFLQAVGMQLIGNFHW
ncbi:MAG: hypothetical protein WKF34_14230 [Pyrinomonadaceae bacterium]